MRATMDELTPQELQISRMPASGLSNRDIGEQLYLSQRTISVQLYLSHPSSASPRADNSAMRSTTRRLE